MTKTSEQQFREAGFAYEHPGYYAIWTEADDACRDRMITVGINFEGCEANPPADAEFTIQVTDEDGDVHGEATIKGVANVIAAAKLLKEVIV